MARERNTSGDVVTTGGTGFGIMAILVGIENGYISRSQGLQRLIKLCSFLQFADKFHGVFPHWMDGRTGDVFPFSQYDNGGDLVETAFLMEGLLAARSFLMGLMPKSKRSERSSPNCGRPLNGIFIPKQQWYFVLALVASIPMANQPRHSGLQRSPDCISTGNIIANTQHCPILLEIGMGRR